MHQTHQHEMKLIISILALCAFLPSNVFADSFISSSEYDWNGFYAGIIAGAVSSSLQTNYDVELSGTSSETESRNWNFDTTDTARNQTLGAGVLMGYNWQSDLLLIGIEADQSFSNTSLTSKSEINLSQSLSSHRDMTNSVGQAKLLYNLDWTGTVRGRIGLAAENLMVYGTGGIAYGHVSGSAHATANWYDYRVADTTKREGLNVGWVAGCGIEYGAKTLSLGIEFVHLQFRPVHFNWNVFSEVAGKQQYENVINAKVSGAIDNSIGIVRTTLKWHF